MSFRTEVDVITGEVRAVEMTPDELAALAAPASADDLRAHAAARRFRVETGGVAVGGATVDTTRESQSMINGALAFVQVAGAASMPFKAKSGWITLTGEEVAAIAVTVAGHVQACFAAERAVDEAITDGTITTREQIDAWPWPGTI